jgi:MFS family permease
MGDPNASRLGLITSVVFIGGFVGAFLASPTSDYLGRRYGMLLGSALSLVGTILQTAAQSSDMFIGGRFLVGLGISFTCVAGPPLLYELSHPSMRATITSSASVNKEESRCISSI